MTEDAAAAVTAVTRDGDVIEVSTTITDPRGASGSDEAKMAVAICQAAVDELAAVSVTVNEADGTAFALYRPAAFMEIPAKTCGEV